MSGRRVRAILRKELREYRHNGSIVGAMAILPLVFTITPLAQILSLSGASAGTLAHHVPLVYMLGIPLLVPAVLAAYAVVGERSQGTLEPVLSTPVRAEELLLGKALAVLLPALVMAYAVFGLFAAAVEVFAAGPVAAAVISGPGLLAQLLFTPLLAAWSIWVGLSISMRLSDPRAASQISLLASLPGVAVTTLIAYGVIQATLGLALGLGAGLLVIDLLGWRLVAPMFDRERMMSVTRT